MKYNFLAIAIIIIPFLILASIFFISNEKVEVKITFILYIFSIILLLISLVTKTLYTRRTILLLISSMIITHIPIIIFVLTDSLLVFFISFEYLIIPISLFLLFLFYHSKYRSNYRPGTYSIIAFIAIYSFLINFSLHILNFSYTQSKDISFLRLSLLIQLGIVIIFDSITFLSNYVYKKSKK
jgi:hypothetical protein